MAIQFLESQGSLANKPLYCMFYGGGGAGKTWLGLDFPGPALVDFEKGYLTAAAKGINPPVLRPTDEQGLWEIMANPEGALAMLGEAIPRYKEYESKTFVFDSATSLQKLFMGNMPVKDASTGKIIKPGKGILGVNRNRNPVDEPSIEDWRALSSRMETFFQNCLDLSEKYNVVVTAHSIIDEKETEVKDLKKPPRNKIIGGFPNIVGRLKYHVGSAMDLYLYMEQDVVNDKAVHYAYSLKKGHYEARTRFEGLIDYKLKNPTYADLVEAYNKAAA